MTSEKKGYTTGRRAWGIGALLFLLVGCRTALPMRSTPSPPVLPSPTSSVTPAYETPSPTPTWTPSPEPTQPCMAVQVLEASVALPPLEPGSAHEIRWRLINLGACAWPLPLQAQPEGEEMPPDWDIQVEEDTSRVEPGQVITVRLRFLAPTQPGRYAFAWSLRTAQGQALVTLPPVTFQVLPPTPTPTWSPPVLVQRQITLRQGQTVNFDDGVAEIGYDVKSDADQALGHVGRYVYFYQTYVWPPDFAQCYHAPYEQLRFNSISNPHWKIGTAYCYITNEGRVGAFRIDNAYTYQGEWYVVLTYITWSVFR